jgi:phosphoribosylglycinamide formyltransferase-1
VERLRAGILISGRGSNMQALIRASRDPNFPAAITVVVSSHPKAPGLALAAEAGIPTVAIDPKGLDRDAVEGRIQGALAGAGVELVCLAGFMRLLSAEFVNRWAGRLVNIHPSLLPAFKGLDVHKRVLESGARFSGCSVHFVTPDVDDGPIIVQAVVPVLAEDTEESLAARVLAAEHRIYPLALRWIAERRLRVEGRRVVVAGAANAGDSIINPPAVD